ncbi:MAG: hypothetical protein HKL82_00340 [Acidimicrobiaceae bacterium]|nr:hypothetical protein [Acidimicrobiaceae bacterium]
MAIPETFKTIQDQSIDTIKLAQDSVVKVVKGYSESVKAVVPAMPEVPELPFADKLPKATEVLDNAFGYAARMLEIQREFALNLVAASAPKA